MSTIKVVSMTGAEVGTVELNDAIFGVEPNMSVVHEVVKNHLANCRQGTARVMLLNELSIIVMSLASLATEVPSPMERPT